MSSGKYFLVLEHLLRNMLFEVVSPDGLCKKMIQGKDIEEIINLAIIKFNLPNNNCKLALLDDLTEIKNSEVLTELDENYQRTCDSPATLKLLPKYSETSSMERTFAEGNICETDEDSSFLEKFNAKVKTSNLDSHIWSKAPERLLAFCREKRTALAKDRRALVAIIVDYLVYVLKDYRKKACETIAKMICNKYPCTFCDKIGDEVYGEGHRSLMQQIYNAVMYKKRCIDKESGCAVKRSVDSDDEDEVKNQARRDQVLKQNKYGCVEYFPVLPANETHDSQQKKRLTLIGLYENSERDGREISTLMKETYPSQRASIVIREGNIQNIVNNWPFLKESRFLIDHCGRLLGKNIEETWNSFARTKLQILRNYLKAYSFKAERRNSVKTALQTCFEACISAKSQDPELLLIFPLLINYFNEEESHFIKIVDTDLPDAEVHKVSECDNPVLVIRGNSMFDLNCKCTVVLKRKIEIKCESVLHGILAVFCSYYCFGFLYPPQVERTLEYIQREIMKINPPVGHKKTIKKRRRQCFDAAVLKLVKAVDAFYNQ